MAFQTKMVNIISLYLFIWHTSSAEYYVPKYSNGILLISVTKIQRPNTFVDAISECFDQNVQLRRLTCVFACVAQDVLVNQEIIGGTYD